MRQQALARGLHAGDGALRGFGERDQAVGGWLRSGGNVEVVAHHVKEGVGGGEVAGAEDGVAVAERLGLWDEVQTGRVAARGVGVTGLVAGPDDDADFLNVGGEGLFDQDAEDGLFLAVAIDQGLEWQRALALTRGGDDSFLDAQRGSWMGIRDDCPEDNCSPELRDALAAVALILRRITRRR